MIGYVLAGLIGGLNSVIWGIYGDLMVEKFRVQKVFRSLLFAAIWALILFVINANTPLLVVALIVIALERGTTEVYKALIRTESQDKYLIPSNPFRRTPAYLKYLVAIILGLITLLAIYYDPIVAAPTIFIALAIGFIVAIAGMSKDAPYEGFEPLKFFRSPIVALLVYAILVALYPSLIGIYLLLAIAGGERVLSEFYKKIFRGKVPGKFKSKTYNKTWTARRKWLLPVYAINIALLVALYFIK